MPYIADTQVTLGFPAGVARQYRWRFEDGTFSSWRPAAGSLPGSLLRTAPPAAEACEWKPVGLKSGPAVRKWWASIWPLPGWLHLIKWIKTTA